MSESITGSEPVDALLAVPGLGVEHVRRPQILDFSRYRGDPVFALNVPRSVADFFIEAFASDQGADTQFLANKSFPRRTTLRFSLPVPLPLQVQTTSPGMTTFGFYPTEVATAEEARELVKFALNTIAKRETYIFEFTNVDQTTFTTEEVGNLARDFDLVILKEDGPADTATETQSFKLTVMKSHWSAEIDAEFKSAVDELFEVTRVAFCKTCGLVFAPSDNDGKCVVHQHRGRQIPLDSGEWEEIELDENDEPVTIVKYTCCKEVPLDAPGCQSVEKGAHVIDQEKSNNYCKFAVRSAVVYPT
jgi:hypothetical protein